ncbi:DUF6447 family protein [Burkholderiaceae bacterium]|nr:DUF6447 family protein [Burkholderiaceae bacterium]
MLNIKLDDKAYDITTVSDEAKAQLAGFKFVDAKLQRRQGQTAALQTDSVANALKAELPDPK